MQWQKDFWFKKLMYKSFTGTMVLFMPLISDETQSDE